MMYLPSPAYMGSGIPSSTFASTRSASILGCGCWQHLIDGTDIEVTLVNQVRLLRRPKRPIAGMRFLPARLRTWVLNKILISAQRQDVMQDVVIWRRKTFRSRPLLCRSDGEIMKFRRYCEQFYSDGQLVLADERPDFGMGLTKNS